jgi:hypothetical protein
MSSLLLQRSRSRSTCVAYRKERRRRSSAGTPSIRINSLPQMTPATVPKGVAAVNPAVQKPSAGVSFASEPQQQCGPSAVAQIGESSENPKVASALPTNNVDNNLEKLGQGADQKQKANGLKRPNLLGKLGIGGENLGMTITRAKGGGGSFASNTGNNELSTKQFECTVKPLKDGVLDMYSYHRGREGMDPRDPESGELLCPLEPSDTNHDCDAPKLGATVVIEFPLDDEVDSKVIGTEAKESMDKAIYRETLQWDLSDPSTPSPLCFATDIANEYGLSFGQRMDLAISIEQQIESHLQQNCSYSAPLALKDPLGNERRFGGPTIHTHLYDQVLQTAEGGIRQPRKQTASRQARVPTPSSKPQTTANASTAEVSTASRRTSLERVYEPVVFEPEEDVEPEYREEVKKRTRAASVLDVSHKCKNGIIGVLEKKQDFHCHVCHKRCKVTYNFACGIVSHSYCEMHCKVRIQ